ncbi:MAG: hypothetical protein H6581_26350 [Bacteroidia bacterium]|nr:hypothetical protein [Bacteroidia bacterium]
MILGIIISPGRIFSQNQPSNLPLVQNLQVKVENIGVNEGLSAGYVFTVAQDSLGYIWLGTLQGLNRYDGYQVREYVHVKGDSQSLPNNGVTRILVDSRGWIWLRTVNENLVLFDPQTETFAVVDSFCTYWLIAEDGEGNIWFPDRDHKWRVIVVKEMEGTAAEKCRSLQLKRPHDLYPGIPSGDLPIHLLNSRTSGLWWEEGDFLVNVPLQPDGKARKYPTGISSSKSAPPWLQPRFVEDTAARRIYYFQPDQWSALDPATGKVLWVKPAPQPEIEKIPTLIDGRGRIYLITYQGGLRLDPEKNQWARLYERKQSPGENEDYDLGRTEFKDRNGNIWYTSPGYGAFRYQIAQEKFSSFGTYQSKISPGGICPLDSHRVVYYTGYQLHVLDPQTGESSFLHPNLITHQLTFFELLKGRGDTIWIGLADSAHFARYIYRASPKTLEEVTSFRGGPKCDWPLTISAKDHSFWMIFQTGLKVPPEEAGMLFIKRFYPRGRDNNLVPVTDSTKLSFPPGEILSWAESPEGKIWIGFDRGGLVSYDFREKKWEQYLTREDSPASLADNRVYSLQPDPVHPDSFLWAGTARGLEKLDLHRKTFTHFNTENGLPNNVVYGILQDDHLNFWLSTNRGLCLFNPRTLQTRNFTPDHGLEFNEFNGKSYARTPDGTMFFGGVGGLVWFDPNEFYLPEKSTPTLINALRLGNRDIIFHPGQKVKEGEFQLNQPLEFTRKITLDYDERIITFGFANMNFSSPAQNKFRYRLRNFNDEWIYTNQLHEATFTNLDPGKYLFEVQGQNPDGSWNEASAQIQLVIRRPWWLTWWFLLGTATLVFVAVYLLIRNRFRQRKRIEDLRNRISKDLHDEIGSTLSSISMYGIVARKSISDGNETASQLLGRINQSSQEIMEAMNDIVWAIKSDNDKMEDLINRMRAFSTHLGKARDWRVKFHYDESVLKNQVGMVARRNVYLIFKEAVNNAMKYSGGNLLEVKLQEKGRELTIHITDNGSGFDLDKVGQSQNLGGNGLPNMKRRAHEIRGKLVIESSPGKGTRVSISFNPALRPKNQ